MTLRWLPRRFSTTRAAGWRTDLDGEECGHPRFLPLFTIPIAAFLVVILALIIRALN